MVASACDHPAVAQDAGASYIQRRNGAERGGQSYGPICATPVCFNRIWRTYDSRLHVLRATVDAGRCSLQRRIFVL